MATVPRKRKNQIVYYVCNYRKGQPLWERVGSDKREAERRDAQMKKEIEAGTYHASMTGQTTVGTYNIEWFLKRKIRSLKNEKSLWQNHIVKRCPWFLKLRLEDVETQDLLKLISELEEPYINQKGIECDLSGKSVFLIFSIINTMFRDARIEKKMTRNPCELPKGTFDKDPLTVRIPYKAEEALRLTEDERLEPDERMFNTILFYTGVRIGEACGRRFSDYDKGPTPLGCILLQNQYNRRQLKTQKRREALLKKRSLPPFVRRQRKIPVHPKLAKTLDWWWAEGFEYVYCRKPTEDDFIVPCKNRELENHTGSSAYKMFKRSCERVGVKPHTVHSTRHTFITLTRRDHCDKAQLEKITHNAKGDQVDEYTHTDWEPLCEVMDCFMKSYNHGGQAPTVLLHEPHESHSAPLQ